MDNLLTAINMVRKNCLMGIVDLSDACCSIPITEGHHKYLLLSFKGKIYKFLCLPNGLTFAPRIFVKPLKLTFSHLCKHICKRVYRPVTIVNMQRETLSIYFPS